MWVKLSQLKRGIGEINRYIYFSPRLSRREGREMRSVGRGEFEVLKRSLSYQTPLTPLQLKRGIGHINR